MATQVDKLVEIIRDSQAHNQHIVECIEQFAEQAWQLPMAGTAQVVTFATAEECEAWQAALEECGYETEIVECYKKGNDRDHVKQSRWTCGYDHSDIINASVDDYVWHNTDCGRVDEYVDEVLDESSYDDDYAEMLYSNANEVKDALKGITSSGCVITNNELHILSVYTDNKPVMGFWDEYNDIEYVFGLKIYGA